MENVYVNHNLKDNFVKNMFVLMIVLPREYVIQGCVNAMKDLAGLIVLLKNALTIVIIEEYAKMENVYVQDFIVENNVRM